MKKQIQIIKLSNDIILSKIYLLRGHKVMLDKDLADLYQVTTGNLNKAVARNLKRFPPDFMFQLNKTEFQNLIFHFGTSNLSAGKDLKAGWGGSRKLPNAFTEQGVAMLSGILNSDRAIAVNIEIMRVFSSARKALTDNTELRLEIETIKRKLTNQEKNIETVFSYLDELIEKKENPPQRNKIGFKK